METLELNTIEKEITVAASQQTAFEVFVNQMGLWWPASGHNEDCPMVRVGLEAKAGGRWIGYNAEGNERDLGKVLIYEPYTLFALDWQTDAAFAFNPDLHSEVRVEFTSEGKNHTRVRLTHKNLHLLGNRENAMAIDEGWGGIMVVYQQFATNFSTRIQVDADAKEAERRISEVSAWWVKNFEGKASGLRDNFTVHFGETFVTFEVVDLIPGDTIVWEVKDCYLPWQQDKTEWNGTRVVWELIPEDGGTKIIMTHIGLTPEQECYDNCRQGWTEHISDSLLNLINTGKGKPQ